MKTDLFYIITKKIFAKMYDIILICCIYCSDVKAKRQFGNT